VDDGYATARLINDLRDAINKSAAIAFAATPSPWTVRQLGRHDQAAIVTDSGHRTPAGLPADAEFIGEMRSTRGTSDAIHAAHHDPVNVMRGCQADTSTLVRCEEAFMAGDELLTHFAKQTLREMAERYGLNEVARRG